MLVMPVHVAEERTAVHPGGIAANVRRDVRVRDDGRHIRHGRHMVPLKRRPLRGEVEVVSRDVAQVQVHAALDVERPEGEDVRRGLGVRRGVQELRGREGGPRDAHAVYLPLEALPGDVHPPAEDERLHVRNRLHGACVVHMARLRAVEEERPAPEPLLAARRIVDERDVVPRLVPGCHVERPAQLGIGLQDARRVNAVQVELDVVDAQRAVLEGPSLSVVGARAEERAHHLLPVPLVRPLADARREPSLHRETRGEVEGRAYVVLPQAAARLRALQRTRVAIRQGHGRIRRISGERRRRARAHAAFPERRHAVEAAREGRIAHRVTPVDAARLGHPERPVRDRARGGGNPRPLPARAEELFRRQARIGDAPVVEAGRERAIPRGPPSAEIEGGLRDVARRIRKRDLLTRLGAIQIELPRVRSPLRGAMDERDVDPRIRPFKGCRLVRICEAEPIRTALRPENPRTGVVLRLAPTE